MHLIFALLRLQASVDWRTASDLASDWASSLPRSPTTSVETQCKPTANQSREHRPNTPVALQLQESLDQREEGASCRHYSDREHSMKEEEANYEEVLGGAKCLIHFNPLQKYFVQNTIIRKLSSIQ